jgi:hypothetical protein
MWLSNGREGYRKFRNYIDEAVVPNMLKRSHFEYYNKKQVMILFLTVFINSK